MGHHHADLSYDRPERTPLLTVTCVCIEDGERWVELGPSGRETRYGLMRQKDKVGGFGGTSMITNNIDKLYKQLLARGVTFKEVLTLVLIMVM